MNTPRGVDRCQWAVIVLVVLTEPIHLAMSHFRTRTLVPMLNKVRYDLRWRVQEKLQLVAGRWRRRT